MAGMAHVRSRPGKTVEDYLALPHDVVAELIDGELYVTPAPAFDHQDVLLALAVILRPFVEAGGLGRVVPAPVDVHLDSGDVVQPDIVFVATAHLDRVHQAIHGAPDLAIEVLSPARPERDRIVKKRLYAENGVPEYWIVDPEARAVEVFRLDGDSYEPAGWFTGDATVVSPLLPDLAVPLAEVFRPVD